MQCLLCQRSFNSLGGLHGHLKKSHSQTQEDYYYFFEPRYDLYDKELIVYRNLNQYRETDFNCRDNFVEWLTENYRNPATKEYCLNKLQERAERKNHFVVPSQVELKSLLLPSLLGFEKLYGTLDNFFAATAKLNIKPRFDYNAVPVLQDKGELKIFVDSREQNPLQFPCETSTMKVPCGDYFPDSNYFNNVFAERKSLADLAGTLGGGLERFIRELDKARELGFYIVVVVECLFSDVLHYTSTNRYSKKMTGAHLTHTIRQLNQSHPNVQWVFTGTRKRAADIIEKIFRLGEQVRVLDLEFLKDGGLI